MRRARELLGVGTEAAHKRLQRSRARLIAALAAQRPGVVTEPAPGCRDARAHAHELLDGTLPEAARMAVQGHLDSCARCPAALEVAVVLAALRRWCWPHCASSKEGQVAVREPLREWMAQLVRAADEAP